MFTRRYSRLNSLLHRQASQNAKVQKVFQETLDAFEKISETDKLGGLFRTLSHEMKQELENLGVSPREIRKYTAAFEQADNLIFEYTQKIGKIHQFFYDEKEKYED